MIFSKNYKQQVVQQYLDIANIFLTEIGSIVQFLSIVFMIKLKSNYNI